MALVAYGGKVSDLNIICVLKIDGGITIEDK